MKRWQHLLPITLALGACGGIANSQGETLADASAVAGRPAAVAARAAPSVGRIAVTAPAATAAATSAPPPDREAELAQLPKYSPQWWALHDAIEAEADARLAKALIICSGCFSPGPEDETGAVK
jgi:hypothetical protein